MWILNIKNRCHKYFLLLKLCCVRAGFFGRLLLIAAVSVQAGSLYSNDYASDLCLVEHSCGVSYGREQYCFLSAIISNDAACFYFLLNHGIDVDTEEEQKSALFMAARAGNERFVWELLTREATVDGSNGIISPLIIASSLGYSGCAKLLLKWGANIEYIFKEDGGTALLFAADNGHVDNVRLLLENGAKINHQRDNGDTALFMASFRGREECVALLLEWGADTELQQTEVLVTPLWAALANGHLYIAELLLNSGGEPEYSTY